MVSFDNLPVGAQANIITAMIKIAVGNEGKEINKLMSKICIDEDQKALLWRAIIDQLYSQRKKIGEGINHPLPTREEDFINEQNQVINSLIQIIQELCDAKDIEGEDFNVSKLYQKIEDNTNIDEESNYWNESVAKLVKKIIQLFELYNDDNKDNQAVIKDDNDNTITSIGDLREANAANTFEIANPPQQTEWVKPFKNIDNKNYNEIRLHDQIYEILSNSNKIDMTKKKKSNNIQENNDTSFISLILPRYGRRVEIEDLDRNFWTIAQIIDGMSNWIFETSPFSEVLSKLINETVQLWENILYLWLQLALIQQKKSDEILSIISPIKMIQSEDLLRYESIVTAVAERTDENSFNIQIPKFKFLGTINNLAEQEKPNPLIDLEETYAEQDLCYISKIKVNNYRSNFYNGEYFDNIYLSILNGIDNDIYKKRKLFKYEIKELYKKQNGENGERPLIISLAPNCEPLEKDEETEEDVGRFTTKLLSSTYFDGKFILGYPFSETPNYLYENKRQTMYCGIRTVPKITFERNETGEKIIKNFNIKIYDAINSIFIQSNDINTLSDRSEKERLIGEYTLKEINGNKILMEYKENKNLKIPEIISKTLVLDNFSRYSLTEISWENVDFAYYLGDCISWRAKTARFSNVKNIINQQAILLKIGNFLPEGVKGDHVDYPMPAIGMMPSINKLASQFRGDFTFSGVPVFYNSKTTEEIEDSDTHNSDVLGRDEYNSFGRSDGSPGKLSFFYFDWSTYLPNKDRPGETVDLSTQNINSLSDGLCFQTSMEKHCKKAFGKDVNENFLYNQGIAAVKNFILKTKKIVGHPYQFLYQTPCYFITFIGISPRLNATTGLIEQDINAACHYIKYLPHYSSLQKKESIIKNYQKCYDNTIAINNGLIIDEDNVEIGKLIDYGFINRYDSYYDLDQFKSSLNNDSAKIYTSSNEKRFLMIEHNTDNEKSDCCKQILINETQYEYIIKFSQGFLANNYYFDLQAAADEHKVQSLLLGQKDDKTQVSEGIILLENGIYSQTEEGAIRAYNRTSFFARKNNSSIQIKEADKKDTALLTIKNSLYRQQPFINGSFINQENLTISELFGIINGDFKNCEFKYTGDSSEEKPDAPYDDHSIMEDENTPAWIILQNYSFGYDPINIERIFKTAPDSETLYFPFVFISKEKSNKKAYNDFYYNLKIITSNYALSRGATYYTNKDYYIDEDKSSKERGDLYLINRKNPNNKVHIKVLDSYLNGYYKDIDDNWKMYSYMQRGEWKIDYVQGTAGARVFRFNDEESETIEKENVLMLCNEVFPSDPTEEVETKKFIVILTKFLDGETQAVILSQRINEPDYNKAYETLCQYEPEQGSINILKPDTNAGIILVKISDVEGVFYLCTNNIETKIEDDKVVWYYGGKKYPVSWVNYNLIQGESGKIYLTQNNSINESDQQLADFIYYYPITDSEEVYYKDTPRIILKKYSDAFIYQSLEKNYSKDFKYYFTPTRELKDYTPKSEYIIKDNGGTSKYKNQNYPDPELATYPIAFSDIEDGNKKYVNGYMGLTAQDGEYIYYNIFKGDEPERVSYVQVLSWLITNETNYSYCIFQVSSEDPLFYNFIDNLNSDRRGQNVWGMGTSITVPKEMEKYWIYTSEFKSHFAKITFNSSIMKDENGWDISNRKKVIDAELEFNGNFIILPKEDIDRKSKYNRRVFKPFTDSI